jgi:peptide/nickel transport system permease protein
MVGRIAVRTVYGILTVLFLVIIIFLLIRLLPGDPAILMAGEYASAADVQRIRETMGLDQPLYVQLGLFLQRIAVGDLGKSIRTQVPVLDEITGRVGRTAQLAVSALSMAILTGISLAILGTSNPGSIMDRSINLLATIAYSTPLFWIALILMNLLGVSLGVLPTSGHGTWRHLVLPMSVLAFYLMGPIAQLTRGSLGEVMNQDYILMARAKGVFERLILYQHALRNAILPVLAYLGTQVGLLFGGAAIVETVFSWHGLGMLVVTSALSRDYPLLQGCVLVIGIVFVSINSLLEYLYEIVDPRLQHYS